MKWLYRILRLFFCPHKYITVEKFDCFYNGSNKPNKTIFRQECRYCGEPNIYEVR